MRMLTKRHCSRIFIFIVVLSAWHNVFGKTLNGFDLSNSLIPSKYIIHGGPPRDGIPAILKPNYVDARQASFMRDTDIVLGIELGGTAVAYPRHILNWHELVNDEINGRPILVSYCPLCGTGMAFSAEVEGTKLTFGVSGLLYNSDLIFYDKRSESLWSQLEGRAISGKYVGKLLKQLVLRSTTWSAWLEAYPNTRVLSEQQGVKRNYRHDPYSGYETSSRLFFKTLRETPSEFHTKERVLGVNVGGNIKAYPFIELRRFGKTEFIDKIGNTPYRIRWNEQSESAAIERLEGEEIATTIAFWFAWYNFNPDTLIFRAADKRAPK